MKRLNELFKVESDLKIESIHSDSRYVRKDSIFFCIEGLVTDGHKYVDDAIFQGAKCIVHSKPLRRYYQGIVYVQVPDVLDELNRVADLFYDHPSYKMTGIGVTGTSGKTVVARVVARLLGRYLKMGYVGNNGIEYGATMMQMTGTTPDPICLHRNFYNMVKENVKGFTLEVSSHGLALKRVDSVNFSIVVFTNAYEEHMDFHGTIDNLMVSYEKLFRLLKEGGYAILNADEVRFNHFLSMNYKDLSEHAKILSYGIHHKADIMARNIEYFIDHSTFDICIKNRLFHVEVPIIAPFNISNTLAILTTLYALEMTPEEIVNAIKYIQPVEGRMEVVPVKQPFHIIVDYCQHAHNFEEVFKFVHSVKGNGHLIAVFGAPGRKDIHKRSKIGALANKYCDYVILTEQDERDDDIEGICEQIQEQIVDPISVIITNRRFAIQQAIDAARAGDVILILGKGHEQFMTSLVGNTPYPGDKFIAQEYAKQLYNQELEEEL